MGIAFIPWHFAEAAANLLTNDALDPQALIPEFKACAVHVFSVKKSDLPNPDEEVTGRQVLKNNSEILKISELFSALLNRNS